MAETVKKGSPPPSNIKKRQEDLHRRIVKSLSEVGRVTRMGKTSLAAAIGALLELRRLEYENINQYVHEAVCILALQRLKRKHKGRFEWYWRPHQLSGFDVEAREACKTIIAAECSGSENPRGTVWDRLKYGIEKLAADRARFKYFFVISEVAEAKAKRFVDKHSYRVRVERLKLG